MTRVAGAWREAILTSFSARRIKAEVARAVFPQVERLWAAGFAALGRVRRAEPTPRSWRSAGGLRVVIVAPHPDDETIGSGGVTALHLRAGDHVTVVVITDGRRSRAGGLDAETMARRRSHEVEAATGALGGPVLVQLGFPEGRWQLADLVERLAPFLCEADIVYAPSCVDYHPEHVAVARALAGIIRADQIVRVYQVGVPLTARLANMVADIGTVQALKQQALDCYETQADSLAVAGRLGRYLAGQYRLPAVEVFWELSGDRYARMMVGTGGAVDGRFRGLRRAPLGDPLVWLVGKRTRARLYSFAVAGAAERQHAKAPGAEADLR